MRVRHPADPKDLVAEAFRIEGIGIAECRTILLDWALSLPEGMPARRAAAELLSLHGDAPRDHPMLKVLSEATGAPPRATRRGGARARWRPG